MNKDHYTHMAKTRKNSSYGCYATDPEPAPACINCVYRETYYHGWDKDHAVFTYRCCYHGELTSGDIKVTYCDFYERK